MLLLLLLAPFLLLLSPLQELSLQLLLRLQRLLLQRIRLAGLCAKQEDVGTAALPLMLMLRGGSSGRACHVVASLAHKERRGKLLLRRWGRRLRCWAQLREERVKGAGLPWWWLLLWCGRRWWRLLPSRAVQLHGLGRVLLLWLLCLLLRWLSLLVQPQPTVPSCSGRSGTCCRRQAQCRAICRQPLVQRLPQARQCSCLPAGSAAIGSTSAGWQEEEGVAELQQSLLLLLAAAVSIGSEACSTQGGDRGGVGEHLPAWRMRARQRRGKSRH